eukprot:gene6535-7568_t
MDLIFEFETAYLLLDELILAGELQDTSTVTVIESLHGGERFEKHQMISEAIEQSF